MDICLRFLVVLIDSGVTMATMPIEVKHRRHVDHSYTLLGNTFYLSSALASISASAFPFAFLFLLLLEN